MASLRQARIVRELPKLDSSGLPPQGHRLVSPQVSPQVHVVQWALLAARCRAHGPIQLPCPLITGIA